MAGVLVGQFEHDSPEWHAARRGGLGGSEIAAVVGLSPWESRFALWHRKAGNIGGRVVTPSMNWGHRLEPVVLAAWREKHPEHAPELGVTFRHPERPWQIANPDHLVAGGVVEIKTADKYDAHQWGPSGSDIIPPYYECQGQWYADVLGVEAIHFAVLIGGNDYREYELPYKPDDAAWLVEQGQAFMDSIEAGQAPPLDGSNATYQAVRALHPEIDGTDIDLDPQLWARLLATESAADDAADLFAEAKSTVLASMGTARRGLVNDTVVCRREARGTGTPYLKTIPQPRESKP